MSLSKNSIPDVIRANRRAFAVSIIVGATLALGVRSMFVDADGTMAMAEASTAPDHHAEAGHGDHGHDASMPMDDGDVAAPADEDGHGGHGAKPEEKPEEGAHGAHGAHGDDASKADTAKKGGPKGVLLDLGNANCPVMDGDVNGKTFTEWRGLRVGHCCPGCTKKFLADPETQLDKVSPKWRDAAKAVEAIDAAEGAKQEKLLAKAAKKWTVVRKPAVPGLLIDVGNTECPVMGGEPDGKTFSEWRGLRVNHCCGMCGKKFLANPEALLDEVAPNWRDAVAAVKSVNDAEGKDRKKALSALRKKWTVVREPAPAATDSK